MSVASRRRWRRKLVRWIAKWGIPALVLEALLLATIIIQAKLYWDQIEEMRIDRRAWASVRDIKGFPEPTKVFRPTIFVTNTGRTFAKHLKVVAGGRSYRSNEVPHFAAEIEEVAKKRNPDVVSDVLLAPNAVVETTLDQQENEPLVPMTTTNVEAIKNAIKESKIRYLTFGQVSYEDIFRHLHWVIFCERLLYDPLQTENGGWSWGTCKEWNDAGDGDPPVRY